MRFLAFAADKLPLAVPRYDQAVPHSRAATNGYAVYRYLRGHAMRVDALSPEKRQAAAHAIAMFLRALHGWRPPTAVPHRFGLSMERRTKEEAMRGLFQYSSGSRSVVRLRSASVMIQTRSPAVVR